MLGSCINVRAETADIYNKELYSWIHSSCLEKKTIKELVLIKKKKRYHCTSLKLYKNG